MTDPTPYITVEDKDGNEIRLDDLTSEPSNRLFRDAWSLSGTVISEDLDTAKDIFRDKVREIRKPLKFASLCLKLKMLFT